MLTKENSASTNFMVTAAGWLIVGVFMGLVLALQFVFPDLFRGVPWLVFSRLRQAHVNTVLFSRTCSGGSPGWCSAVFAKPMSIQSCLPGCQAG